MSAATQIVVTGLLLQDAELRVVAGGASLITVVVAQPGNPPLRAVEVYGADHAALHAATAKARTLRRGGRVELRGEGLVIGRTRGLGPVVQLHLVTRLQLLDSFDPARAAANDHH